MKNKNFKFSALLLSILIIGGLIAGLIVRNTANAKKKLNEVNMSIDSLENVYEFKLNQLEDSLEQKGLIKKIKTKKTRDAENVNKE